MLPPRTLIFDLSEVIIAGIVGIEHALAPRLGVPLETVLPRFWGAGLDTLCRGRTTEAHYLDDVRAAAQWPIERAELAEMLRANFRRQVDGTEAVLRELEPVCELVLLSDHAREWIEFIECTHPLLALFRRRFYSFDFGSLKREASTFHRVLAALGRRAAECLLVDDSAANTTVARQCGLRTIQFSDTAALRRELCVCGIAIGDAEQERRPRVDRFERESHCGARRNPREGVDEPGRAPR